MFQSMTGFGVGHYAAKQIEANVEIRSVNNRHLKIIVRGSEPYPSLENEFEKQLKTAFRRGTITVFVKVKKETKSSFAPLNTNILKSYIDQIKELSAILPADAANALYSSVLRLPGVASDVGMSLTLPEDEWPIVEKALKIAMQDLLQSRQNECKSMIAELKLFHQQISDCLVVVRQYVPHVVVEFKQKLVDRIKQALSETNVSLDESHLVREIAIYADRTDISEEICRLEGHLQAVADLLKNGGEGAGRRLEFIAQEMGREVNTMGSKAGHAKISAQAIEIKAILEKLRELVLNIE